jgi:PAS domain S-box-containing protein
MNPNPENKNNDTRASLELLYHVSREIATAFDLPTLLERILHLSIQTIGAVNGSIIALDDSGTPVASTLIINTKVVLYSTEQLKETLDNGLAGWVVKKQRAVLIPDTSKDERWLRRPDDAADATGSKSVISAPFLTRDRLAGVITLVHPNPNFFQPGHRSLVQAIADQSAVAVLNALLHNDTRRQARIMTALAESATAITGSLNLSEVLQRILEQISLVLDAEAVSLAMINYEDGNLEFSASTSHDEHSPVGMKLKLGEGVAGWVAQEKTGIIVQNAYDDYRFYSSFDKDTGFKTKAIACSPIFSQDEVIGILEAINPRKGVFDSDALQVLNGISSLAGTAIRHAQLFEALQAAHKRYRDLFESNINSIIITDLFGEILEANQQSSILSHYDKEALRSSFIEKIHDIDLKVLGMNFEKISANEAISYESVLYTKIETEVPITVMVQSINIEGKTFLQWVFRDDTKRKELDQLREDLVSMIYHDLRSPLANVVTSLDLLSSMKEFDDDSATDKSLFDIAVRSTKRILRLTQSLLDINRLEAGQPVTDKLSTSPQTLLQDTVEELKPIIQNKRIKAQIDIPDHIPNLVINEEMIQRVLINLTENAIKFSPQEGLINLGARQIDNFVRIWVQDSGPGIPGENLQSIFDKYTRLHSQGGPKGYGLGLAYCRLAVEGHGGKIWVENVQEGGSHFTFTIPISAEDESNEVDVESEEQL